MLERVRGTLICMRGGGVESGADDLGVDGADV
jgi:hypothetical protein